MNDYFCNFLAKSRKMRYGLAIMMGLLLCSFVSSGQKMITINSTCTSGNIGDTVCVPVTITGASNMLAIAFSFHWDVFAVDTVIMRNVSPEFTNSYTPFPDNGFVNVVFISPDFNNGTTFPANTLIFEACLVLKGPPGNYPIGIQEGPVPPEFADLVDNEIPFTFNNCNLTINDPSNLSVFPSSCYSSSLMEGTINVQVFGGTPPYTITGTGPQAISGSVATVGGTYSAGMLPAGTYNVTVTDNTGAQRIQSIDLIATPTDFRIQTIPFNPICPGDANGSMVVSPQGGTSPYKIEWSNGAINVNEITNLPVGNYSVTVTDANGCVDISSNSVQIEDISFNVVQNNTATCLGLEDGALRIQATGGTPGPGPSYSYQWSTGVFQPNAPIAFQDNLDPGNYSVTATDQNGCIDSTTVTVLADKVIQTSFTLDTVRCNGNADGSVHTSITANPGTLGNLNTQIVFPNGLTSNGIPGDPNNSFNNLFAGDYILAILDDDGCRDSVFFNMPEPEVLDTLEALIQGESCSATGMDGAILLQMTGGNRPYQYSWENGISTDSVATNLVEGLYSVSVTDRNGCGPFVDSFQVVKDRIDFQIDTTNPILCFGDNNGGLSITTGSGVTLSTIAWNNGTTSNAITNLSSGTYYVTVTGDGCVGVDSAQLQGPLPLQASFVVTNPTCANEPVPTGSISVLVSGGTAPHSYAWSHVNGSDNPLLPSVGEGDYSVTITDANNCPELVADTNLIEPPAMILTFDQVDSARCWDSSDGAATILVTNGIPTYVYAWDNGETTDRAQLLSPGIHRVTVADANNCNAVDSVNILNPNPITLDTLLTNINNVSCNGLTDGYVNLKLLGGKPGYSVLWPASMTFGDSLGLVGAGAYWALVRDANMCSDSVLVSISEPDSMRVSIDTLNTQPETCAESNDGRIVISVVGGNTGPRTYVWTDGVSDTLIATGLDTGFYQIMVTDARGCTEEASHFLTGPNPINVPFDTISAIPCFGDAATIIFGNITGGNAPTDYVVSVNGGPEQPGDEPLFLESGEHSLRFLDRLGCFVDTTLILVEPPEIEIDYGTNPVVLDLGDSVRIDPVVTGIQPFIEFAWNPTSRLSCLDLNCLSVNLSPLTTTTYTLMVTDSTGCIQAADLLVQVRARRNVFIPNVFSPNNDGVNELFKIYTGPGVEEVKYIRIFDRWGNMLFEQGNLSPGFDGVGNWDGSVNNQIMNPGVYVYAAEVSFIDGISLIYRGDITLVR